MRRAAFYIDGQNIYHDLKNRGLPARCLNYYEFAKFLCAGNNGHSPKELVSVKYYTAKYPAQLDRVKHNSDDAYFKSLEKLSITVKQGRFLTTDLGNGKLIPREKGVDVLLAVDLLVDAFHNSFDDAYVLTSDTDILPAITEVKSRFTNTKIFSCSFKTLTDFTNACHGHVKMHEGMLKPFFDAKSFQPTATTIGGLTDKFTKKH